MHLDIPCGQCLGCRISNSKDRAIRCIHEASLYKNNSFLTLTLDNEHLPKDHNLDHEIFKKFLKKLRIKLHHKIRYFMCGEYGGELENINNQWIWDRTKYKEPKPEFPRAHYHALIFNFTPRDGEVMYKNHMQQEVLVSNFLNRTWKNGHVSYGAVSWQSAAYVARYLMKKQNSNKKTEFVAKYGQPLYDKETGEKLQNHPTKPEYSQGSTQPAIGKYWYDKYKFTDCFNQGFLLGKPPEYSKQRIPRYYWDLLKTEDINLFNRYKRVAMNKEVESKKAIQNTYEQQDTRERILQIKTKKLKRNI